MLRCWRREDTRVSERRAEVSGSHQVRQGEELGRYSRPYAHEHTGYATLTRELNTTWQEVAASQSSTAQITFMAIKLQTSVEKKTARSRGQQLSNLLGQETAVKTASTRGCTSTSSAHNTPPPKKMSHGQRRLDEMMPSFWLLLVEAICCHTSNLKERSRYVWSAAAAKNGP